MKNRTLGSILIVAGTTIGAGMLAMPLASAGVGFGVTLGLLITPGYYTHLRANETDSYLVCRFLLENRKKEYR